MGPFIDQLVASEDVDDLVTAGEVLWPIADHTGTIRDVAELDSGTNTFNIVTHRVYNSFGLLTDEFDPDTGATSSVDIDNGFTGRFHDDLTGLTHHQYRWFDPNIGKWISEDPMGFAAGDTNTTRYVANAPLTYVDPTGLVAQGVDGGNGDAGQGGQTGGGGPTGQGGQVPQHELQILVDKPTGDRTRVFPPFIDVGHVSLRFINHETNTEIHVGLWGGDDVVDPGLRPDDDHPWDIGATVPLTEYQYIEALIYVHGVALGNVTFENEDLKPYDPGNGTNCASLACEVIELIGVREEFFTRGITPGERVEVFGIRRPRPIVTPRSIGTEFENHNPNVIRPPQPPCIYECEDR